MVAEQNSGRADTLLLSKLDNGRGAHHRPTSASERAVSHDVNALFVTQVDYLLLRQAGVVFDLVHGGDDLGMGQKLLEVLFAVLDWRQRRNDTR